MNQIYSPRGMRRGLSFSCLAICIWMAWAFGYSQGVEMNNTRMQLIEVNEHVAKEK